MDNKIFSILKLTLDVCNKLQFFRRNIGKIKPIREGNFMIFKIIIINNVPFEYDFFEKIV